MTNILYRQNDDLVVNTDYEEENGENVEFAIVFNIDEERIHYLNHTAYEIFKIVHEPILRSNILSHFVDQYEMGENEIDLVHKAVDDLVEKKILVIA